MTICLVSLRLICLRYLIEMHSTKVLVCKQACRTLAVQHASYIAPRKGGRDTPERGEGRREHAHTREKRENRKREEKNIAF